MDWCNSHAEAAARESSWPGIDLTSLLTADAPAIEATIGRRTDGVALGYPGRVNGIVGESETFKGWFVQALVAQVLATGGRALYLDFEDNARGIAERLRDLGVATEAVRTRLSYRRPEGPFGHAEQADLASWLADGCDLAVVDGVTEALSLHALSSTTDTDIAAFLTRLPRWLADRGPAVYLVDHVVKNRVERGHWATGSQHKRSGVDGAVLLSRILQPVGRATTTVRTGRARLSVSKDRPGAVRAHTVTKAGEEWIADLVLTANPDGTVDVTLIPPEDDRAESPADDHLHADLRQRITAAVADAAPEPLTTRDIYAAVKGGRGSQTDKQKALEALRRDGTLHVEQGQRGALLHRLAPTNPYGQENQ
ncbi:MAG TPA: AAA family ATPase [Mycobacteriales bacterium]|nr:AAA family ATPase [Mycobacteriales bacterium]